VGLPHDDGVGLGQRLPAAFGQIAVGVDRHPLRVGTVCHRLRHAQRVSIARMKNHRHFCQFYHFDFL